MKLTELCEIGFKYGADKCPQINHSYTPFYYEFLKNKRQTIKKVLEIGVGNSRIKKVIPQYQIGASLRMWRDFFPNAQVYGADILPEAVFKDERLETFLMDETKKEDVEALIKRIGSDIDLVIDDASHHIEHQINLFKYLMPLLQKDVIYIIEDCGRTRWFPRQFTEYNCYIPKLQDNPRPRAGDGIVVITNK